MSGELFGSEKVGELPFKYTKGLTVLIILLFSFLSAVEASETREHGSHVHGIGKLNVALDGKDLFVELDSPAANIIGFEHEPKNDQQKHVVHEAIELLEKGEKLFVFSAKAQCSLHESYVGNDMAAGHNEEHEGHEAHHGDHDDSSTEAAHATPSSHSEFTATYHFKCNRPEKLKTIEVMLFSSFPGFEELEVQLLTPKKQTAVELTPNNNEISL